MHVGGDTAYHPPKGNTSEITQQLHPHEAHCKQQLTTLSQRRFVEKQHWTTSQQGCLGFLWRRKTWTPNNYLRASHRQPPFDGNQNGLQSFIDRIIREVQTNINKDILCQKMLTRIVGRTQGTLNFHITTQWREVKALLIYPFDTPENEIQLTERLLSARFTSAARRTEYICNLNRFVVQLCVTVNFRLLINIKRKMDTKIKIFEKLIEPDLFAKIELKKKYIPQKSIFYRKTLRRE